MDDGNVTRARHHMDCYSGGADCLHDSPDCPMQKRFIIREDGRGPSYGWNVLDTSNKTINHPQGQYIAHCAFPEWAEKIAQALNEGEAP